MISFIVIGKNEGSNLEKCFSSIKTACLNTKIVDYEIIYVDSNSNDNSLEIASESNISKIILLEKLHNPPIGRNIGALFSIGNILVFLDGDMELDENFLSHVITPEGELRYPLVSGRVHQIYYDLKGHVVREKIENEDKAYIFHKPITGGAFIINRDIFFSVQGFDNRFVRSEDPELGLRLAKKGVLLTHLFIPFVRHNTEIAKNYDFSDLIKGYHLYANLFMYKKNITCKFTFMRIWSHDRTLLILILCSFLSLTVSPWFMLLYFLALFARSKLLVPKSFLRRFFYHLIRDISVLVLFPFYYKRPIKTNSIPYKIIQ